MSGTTNASKLILVACIPITVLSDQEYEVFVI
jgi:hypothetical protein